jgi:putative membrane protein
VLGAPLPLMMRALPVAGQRIVAAALHLHAWQAVWRWLGGAALATLLQLLLMWGWHTPHAVASALADDALHITMHASLLAAALLFWAAVLRPVLGHRAARVWVSLAALAVTLKVNGLICITLLLQPGARYAVYGATASAWGLMPAADEQLGWGLMMLVGMAGYSAAAIALLLFGLRPAHGHRRSSAGAQAGPEHRAAGCGPSTMLPVIGRLPALGTAAQPGQRAGKPAHDDRAGQRPAGNRGTAIAQSAGDLE